MIEIIKYHPDHKKEWDDFVGDSKNGTFHVKRDFIEYHGDKFEDSSLMCYDGHNLMAVVPAASIDNSFFSHPGLTYGGIIVKKEIYFSKYIILFESILNYLIETGFSYFRIKAIPPSYSYISNDDFMYCMHRLNATIDRTDILPHIKIPDRLQYQKRRERSIKKARKHSIQIKENQNFSGFWSILTELLEGYGEKPVHTLEEIESLKMSFPENIKLFEATNDQELLGGVVIFETKQVARSQYIAASQEGKSIGALDYLFDVLINEIYPEKSWFDFGTTTLDGGSKINLGLSDQKEGFGARTILQYGFSLDLKTYDPDTFSRIIK